MSMLRDTLIRLRSRLVSPDVVAAYEHALPHTISISYKKDANYFIGYVNEVDGEEIPGLLMTQGKTAEELVTNINQLAYMHTKVPEHIRPYYGNVFHFSELALKSKSGSLVLQRV